MVTKIAELSSSTQFNWVIENFSKLNAKDGVKTFSDVFSVGDFKWKAYMYPKGVKGVYGDRLSLYLHPVDLTTSVHADFCFQVTSQSDPSNTVKRESTKEFPDKYFNAWGWPMFMRLSKLHDPDKGYIVNDTCVIKVEVTCTRNKESETLVAATNIADLSSSTKFNWTIKNFSKLDAEVGFTFSDVFSVGSLKWKAMIYPKGYKDADACDHLSLYLYPVDMTIPVDTGYSFAVTSQTNCNNTVRKELTKTFPDKDFTGWGWPKFMRLSELHDPEKGYIVNDTCVISVEVSCPAKEPEDDNWLNHLGSNKVAKTETKKQTKEKDDKSSSISEEYPEAGQPFCEVRHDYKIGFGDDKEFEDIEGFSIVKTQATLYRKIWLKYGHIPSTKVMPIASYAILVMAVKDLMSCITDMHKCHYVDLSSAMIERWEDMITMAEKLEFNIGWLRERFETMKEGMGGMQNVRTELLEHGKPLRAAIEKLKILSDVTRKVEVQLIDAKAQVQKNACGLLSESDMKKYLEIGENLLLDGLF